MTGIFRIGRRIVAGAALASVAPLLLMSTAPAAQANTTAARASTTADSVPRCTASGLEAWLGFGVGGATAGSVYYPIELTNVSSHTCYLYGYPGVSARSGGKQAGSSARWVASAYFAERTVTLVPGATAHTVLAIADVESFSSSECHPVGATDLWVYPPGGSSATDIPFGFNACSAKGPVYLSVEYIQPGTGVPGYPGL